MRILGIDIGGTTVKALIINSKNKEILKFIKPFKTKQGNNIDWVFEELEKQNITPLDYDLIGISIPGFLNHEKGIVISSGNLKMKNYDVSKEAEKICGKKVYVVNDANAASLGEYWNGVGNKYNSFLYYIIGTGVGGGVFLNGQLIYGANGFAGEFGHGGNFFKDEEIPCGCEQEYCMEPGSNARAYRRELIKKAKNNPSSELGKLFLKKGDSFDVVDIAPLFSKKDKDVFAAFALASNPIAKHISTLLYSVNPEAIIIGGGISNLGCDLLEIIKKEVEKYTAPLLINNTNFELAKLRNDAGSFGAAYWAYSHSKN